MRASRASVRSRAQRHGDAEAQSPPTAADALERVFDGNGHVREAAVRELASAPRPEAIRVLLARANDWVPQVRSAAATALAWVMERAFVGVGVRRPDGVVMRFFEVL